MRRVIRWVDPEGYVSVGVEHPRDGEFSLLRGLEDPTRLLQGESFPLGRSIMPVDEFSLELEPGPDPHLADRPTGGLVRRRHVRHGRRGPDGVQPLPRGLRIGR